MPNAPRLKLLTSVNRTSFNCVFYEMSNASQSAFDAIYNFYAIQKEISNLLFEYHKLVYLYKIENYGTKYIYSNRRIL